MEWSAPTPPPHGNFPNPVRAYRDPYDYSVPGVAAGFMPQNAE
jgi:cytochrome c oxidase subunit 1